MVLDGRMFRRGPCNYDGHNGVRGHAVTSAHSSLIKR